MSEKNTQLPIKLADVKQFLKITHNSEDELLGKLIQIALQKLEDFTGLALLQREFTTRFYNKHLNRDKPLKLPRRPICKIIGIEATGYNGEKSKISEKLYRIHEENSILCSFIGDYTHIDVIYLAGMVSDADNLDVHLQHALLEIVAHMYEYRGAEPALEGVLDRYQNLRHFKL